MNTNVIKNQHSNPIQIGKALCYIATAVILGAVGLLYVNLKNQQFGLGEKIRVTERQIREVRAENEVLIAKITELSSRRTLQQRASNGFIGVIPITGEKIARLSAPIPATQDGVLRTALNDSVRR